MLFHTVTVNFDLYSMTMTLELDLTGSRWVSMLNNTKLKSFSTDPTGDRQTDRHTHTHRTGSSTYRPPK